MKNFVCSMTLTFLCAAAMLPAQAAETTASVSSQKLGPVYSIPVQPMEAQGLTSTTLAPYRGKVLLIVNVASKCGFTPQYKGLEALYKKYQDQGLQIVGFPSNDFHQQEPGTEQQIVEFCHSKYGVTFPLYAKIDVKGDNKAPLYKYLTEGDHPGKGEVTWNFNKFLVDRHGNVVAHFDSKVTPETPELVSAVERELAAK